MKKHINKIINASELKVENKANGSSKVCVIKGYGNVALPDRYNELMPQDCWDLNNYLINPVICINHNTQDINSLVGKATLVEARPEGLYFEAEIGSEGEDLTPAQETVVKLVRQGVLKTLSVGFIPHDYETDKKTGVLKYKKAELLEISLVTVPMQQNSVLTSVKAFNGEVETFENKSEQELQHVEEVEKLLNDATITFPQNDTTEVGSEVNDPEEIDQEEIDIAVIKEQIAVIQNQIIEMKVDIEGLKGSQESAQKNFDFQLNRISNLIIKMSKLFK